MNLEEKLRQLKSVAKKSAPEMALEAQLDFLRRASPTPKPLLAQRAPHAIEHYVDGREYVHPAGAYFMAAQELPFGRPYGKLRIGDIAAPDLSALDVVIPALPDPSRLVYLDTETTGLAGGTGTCAFLIGIGTARDSQFAVRQFFLRDYTEEKATLAALAEILENYDGLVTFNGKTFDVPLLETRYTLARLKSPFTRLVHLDLLHPARRLWKLRLESCRLTNLESCVLGIARKGDVPGSEIPGIYFDYLRTGDAQGLQPVFFHNALDIVTLAALTVELAAVIGAAQSHDRRPASPSLDLFSLSRMFKRAGNADESLSACARALEAGLPEEIEPLALWQLAAQHKRRRDFEQAEQIWLDLARRENAIAIEACQELAIHYEHRRRDPGGALIFTEKAIARLAAASLPDQTQLRLAGRFSHRRARLEKRVASQTSLQQYSVRADE